jgi:hypothetical protein
MGISLRGFFKRVLLCITCLALQGFKGATCLTTLQARRVPTG